MTTKTISISSIFPAASDDIWQRLTQIETLRYIAAPYAMFLPVDENAEHIWREGAVMQFRMRIFGFIPLGIHTIEICTFDKTTYFIESSEYNRMVPIWKHLIRLAPIDQRVTNYTDEIEIGAGALTGMVALWSKAFYRHRQKKWLKLLKRQ